MKYIVKIIISLLLIWPLMIIGWALGLLTFTISFIWSCSEDSKLWIAKRIQKGMGYLDNKQ